MINCTILIHLHFISIFLNQKPAGNYFTLNYDKVNIETIIKDCIAGKQSGYKALFYMYYPFGKTVSIRHATSKEEAEEILDDAFIKVFKNIATYDIKKPFEAWFRVIIINTCIDYYRQRNKLEFEFDDSKYNETSQMENIIDKFGAEEILAIVQKLSPAYRTVFLLYAVEGYTHSEIAAKLQINEITSRTNFVKARAKLQNLMSVK